MEVTINQPVRLTARQPLVSYQKAPQRQSVLVKSAEEIEAQRRKLEEQQQQERTVRRQRRIAIALVVISILVLGVAPS